MTSDEWEGGGSAPAPPAADGAAAAKPGQEAPTSGGCAPEPLLLDASLCALCVGFRRGGCVRGGDKRQKPTCLFGEFFGIVTGSFLRSSNQGAAQEEGLAPGPFEFPFLNQSPDAIGAEMPDVPDCVGGQVVRNDSEEHCRNLRILHSERAACKQNGQIGAADRFGEVHGED